VEAAFWSLCWRWAEGRKVWKIAGSRGGSPALTAELGHSAERVDLFKIWLIKGKQKKYLVLN